MHHFPRVQVRGVGQGCGHVQGCRVALLHAVGEENDPVARFKGKGLDLFNPGMRELVEMQYLFAEPFVVDSSKIVSQLGVEATPVEQALADTLRDYRDG